MSRAQQQIVITPPSIVPSMRSVYNDLRLSLERSDQSKFNRFVIIAGRRKSKTFTVSKAQVPTWFSRKCSFGYAAKDDKATKGGWREITTYISEMRNFFPGDWRFAPSEDGVLVAPNGSIWDKLSLWDADAGRGLTYDCLHVDEIQGVKEDVIANITPTLLTTRGTMILTGTSPRNWKEWEQSQWWIQALTCPQDELVERFPGWRIFHEETKPDDIAYIIRENDISSGIKVSDWGVYMRIAEKELHSLKRQIGETRYNREVLVRLEAPSAGRILKSFTDDHVVDGGYRPDLGGEILVAFDRGGGAAMNVVLVAQKYHAGKDKETGREAYRYRVFAEYASRSMMSAVSLVRNAVNLVPRGLEFKCFPDPRAKDIQYELDQLGIEYTKSSVPIHDGNELLDLSFQHGQIEICKGCKTLIRQLKAYDTDSNGDPTDQDQDTCDALRYLRYNDASDNGEIYEMSRDIEETINGASSSLSAGGVGSLDF